MNEKNKQMKNSTLTPEESLSLISKTIEDTKARFKESGHVFVFWGVLMLIVFGSQFILSELELYKFMMWPVFLFPLGGFYMVYIWFKEVRNKPKTLISNILSNIGWIIGMNLMIMGFIFSDQLGEALGPVFIILLSVMIIVSGLSIKSKPLTIGGAITNLIGLSTFFIAADYHGFSMMLAGITGFVIPGILLNVSKKKENV